MRLYEIIQWKKMELKSKMKLDDKLLSAILLDTVTAMVWHNTIMVNSINATQTNDSIALRFNRLWK